MVAVFRPKLPARVEYPPAYQSRTAGRRRRRGKPFPPSTVGVYRPGVGLTLTRANVAEFEANRRQIAARHREDYQPLNAEQLARAFTRPHSAGREWEPSPRHVARAHLILKPKGSK